jgi:hypothetical protein
MKNNKFLFPIILSFFSINATAQGPFEQLKPTANPAYMLLGVAPTEIERPSTPKEFAAALNSATVNGTLKPNIAIELTPYEMFSSKHKLSYADKAVSSILKQDNFFVNLYKNLSISLATSESDSIALGNLGLGTSAAIGFKTIIYNGKAKDATYSAILSLNSSFKEEVIINNFIAAVSSLPNKSVNKTEIDKIVSDLRINEEANINGNVNYSQIEKEMAIYKLNKIIDHLEKETNKQTTIDRDLTTHLFDAELVKVIAKEKVALKVVNKKMAFAREGFIWDFNGAYMSHLVSNSWDSLKYAKFALWTTFSYRINADKSFEDVALVDFIGLIRYTGNSHKVDSSSYFDFGAKIQFTYNKISFAGEYVGRQLTAKPQSVINSYTDRITGNIDYVINNLITLKISVGRTFDGNSVIYDKPTDKLYAVGGINFSILQGQ